MAIAKIQHIKAVGKFRRHSAKGNVAFKKYNLIFGENARGKTTMCAILRSLGENDGAIILGRHSLGDQSAPEVIINLIEGQARFKDGEWIKPETHIRIFDNHYILENVYTDESIGTDQRRNLCRVLLGRDGARLGSRYNEIDAEITEKNRELRDARNRIAALSEGLSTEEFIALVEDAKIDEKIAAKNKEVDGARQLTKLLSQQALEEIQLPRYPKLLEGLVKKSIDDVSAEAETRVRRHLQKHNMEKSGDQWITEGLPHIIDNECPFCGLPLIEVDLIADFRSYFTAEFMSLREEIVKYREVAERIFSDESIQLLRARIEGNVARFELWQPYLSSQSFISLDGGEIEQVLKRFRGELLSVLDEKLHSLIIQNELPATYKSAADRFMAIAEDASSYNANNTDINAAINDFKERAKRNNLRDIELEARRLLATKRRYEVSGRDACENYLAVANQKAQLETEKSALRSRIDEYGKEVMVKYADSVNVLLGRFRAGFGLSGFRLEYTGRIPNSSFGVVINDVEVEMGSAASPLDEPSFRNTLSGGDRITLALAFFIAQLTCDPDREKALVVFDDPFSSQDHFRRTCTIGEMVRIGNEVAQVVVFSHDKKFLKDIWDYPLPTDQRAALCIEPIGLKDSQLCEWDIAKEAESEDAGNRNALVSYFLRYAGDPSNIIQKLRPVLETHMRRVAPEELRGVSGLGDMIDVLRNNDTSLAPSLPDIEDVNSYTRRYMHGDRSEAEARPSISKEELHGFVDRVLRVVGALR